ncbi:DUF5301 domain-containing protein [Anaerotignum sp.]|uniref:DUF5301 domain-containing protein n=1 Tax=Anaerotignum sp. TaxID=2039241 RepID=UPI00289B7DED|nr:DUF5301 domain-containing protein [Anaerotignum sp.]
MKIKDSSTIVVIIILLLGGFLILNTIFPTAKPIKLPLEDIFTISIFSDTESRVYTEKEDVEEISNYIASAKPTRKISMNDTPYNKPYYKIDMETDGGIYRIYLYEDNSNMYIELPYYGIYVVDEKILLIKQFYTI